MHHGSHTDSRLIDELALIDVGPLLDTAADATSTAAAIDRSCRELGFFRITGHGIDPALLDRLERLSRDFFSLPDDVKQTVAMERSGAAWRGWFPVRGEITSGRPDRKEGLYVGLDHADDHPRVVAGVPLHGRNSFPNDDLGDAVTAWLAAVRPVADALMRALAIGLGIDAAWFERHVTGDPTVLFRIFHYPALADNETADEWGVGEHTDYGLLTLLAQDSNDGLQVKSPSGDWIDVPAEPGVIVCNIGDMLDRLTEGRYRSTPHRVRNTSGVGRLSFPYFFDPSWDAVVTPLPLDDSPPAVASGRWDGADLAAWTGPYGDYLTAKVAKVFPKLFADVTDADAVRSDEY